MPTTRMCDLPRKLIRDKILTRVPITSLRKVRSTCKSWDGLTKTSILGYYATETEQFLGFATMNSKVCSLWFNLKQKGDKKDLVDLSMNQVDLLKKMEISEIFHCDGLLLCVAKDNSKLWVWNPYLNQTRCIGPRTKFHARDKYALGCDYDYNRKILRLMDYYTGGPEEYEIYEFSSNSWRVLTVTPDWFIAPSHRGTTVKGRAYFFAKDRPFSGAKSFDEVANFLVCFDFTRDEFGPRLPLPFHSRGDECVTLSSVGEEQLAVLYFKDGMSDFTPGQLEIWVTTWISPDSVSWSKFLKVEMRPGVRFDEYDGGSFFIDEQEKVAVVFDLDGYLPNKTPRYQTAFIIGEDGFFKSVRLGEAPNLGERCPRTGYTPEIHIPALVCPSAYRPSLVPVNQPRRRRLKRRRSRAVCRRLKRRRSRVA